MRTTVSKTLNQTTERMRNRRGAILAWVAVLLTVLVGFTALCTDVARMFIVRAHLQATADLAALSGVIELPDTTVAEAAVRSVAIANDPISGNAITSGEIEFGTWVPATRTFSTGSTPLNAVRVTLSRDAAHNNSLPLVLMPILGESLTEIHASAIGHLVPRVGGQFSGGLIGRVSVDVNGTPTIDGYDPDAGPYGGDNAGFPGSVLSNGEVVLVSGNSVVTGDARPGPGYDSADVQGNATVGGATEALNQPMDLPPVEIPQNITSGLNDNANIVGTRNGMPFNPINGSGNLTVGTNDTVDMPAGDYYLADLTVRGTLNITGPARIRVTDDLRITSFGTITTSGLVEFYVEGDGTLAGQGIVNLDQNPDNLVIYGTGDDLRWEGGADFYGHIYAPYNTTVHIRGDNSYYGTGVGEHLDINGTGNIHTDNGDGFGGPGRQLPILVD